MKPKIPNNLLKYRSILAALGLCATFQLITATVFASTAAWETIEQKQNPEEAWTLYSRPKSGSEFLEFRIKGGIDAPPAIVLEAVRESLTNKIYTPENEQRSIIKQTQDQLTLHIHINLPGPLSDRTMILQYDFTQDENRVYAVKWQQLHTKPSSKSQDTIEMLNASGEWTLEKTPSGKTFVSVVGHGDLGGSIPAWLINSLSGQSFVKGLQQIRQIAVQIKARDQKNRQAENDQLSHFLPVIK